MATETIRKIIRIDEEKCDGCGLCAAACAEGAIKIIDGKARLVSDTYCDGLGACIGECPRGALTIEEREAGEFNEAAAKQHIHSETEIKLPCGCPGSTVARFEVVEPDVERASMSSMLGHWPVQLTLVPPSAPFLAEADVLLVADCVPFAYNEFHRDFLRGHPVLVACPKLDNFAAHLNKLALIIRQSSIKSLTAVHMEVPCCFGLVHLAREAIKISGKEIPFNDITISVRGDKLSEEDN